VRIRVRTVSPQLLVVFTAALILSLTFQFGSVQASPPTASIRSINYPTHANPSQVIPVVVQAEYSFVSGVDVGIWNLKNGIMIQSVSIPLPKAGKATFDFNLTTPRIEGDWDLTAITRIFWQDGWYQDPNGGLENFTIHISDSIVVVLGSEGAATSVAVDGLQYHVNEGESDRLQMKPGLHTLEAPRMIQAGPYERFVFVGWSDGINSNPRQAVFSTDADIAPIYRTEYYLSVKSDIGNVTGEGWYERGSQATFAAVPSTTALSLLGLSTDDYRFMRWTGSSESTSSVTSIVMDGPKTVEAKWVCSGTVPDTSLVIGLFYVSAFVLAVRSLYRYAKRKRVNAPDSTRRAKRLMGLIVLLSVFILGASSVPATYAQLPEAHGRSVVAIGDAYWNYWNQTGSDTCLLWLGGGLAQEGGPGYNHYWVNPYQYESFGTIRFLQDLSRYYCVVALEKGSYKCVAPTSNRTIYQEPYQLQSQIITQVHDWIKTQGYAHIFIIGYSVGANVAAMEVSIQSPEDWTSPDGLILVTPRPTTDQISSASRMRASLLIMYGGSIETPQYVVAGQEFFSGTPAEGRHGFYYLHKEFHVIKRMGHEVWTVLETGTYDTQALHILVNFVERTKALQFKTQETADIISQAKNSTQQNNAYAITNLRAPRRILSTQMLLIRTDVSYTSQNETEIKVIALDRPSVQVENVLDLTLVGVGQRTINILLAPPFNSSEVSLEIVLLQKVGTGWLPLAGPYFTETNIANTLVLTLETNVPNVTFVLDGTNFPVNKTVELETNPGIHVVQCRPIIYLSSLTRAVFTKWEDGTSTSIRQVNLSNDTTIVAFYRIQYFVNARSPYGQVQGSGWYDQNSIATILLQPPVLREPGVLVAHWTGDTTDSYPRTVLVVNSPKVIEAEWGTIATSQGSNYFDIFFKILPSVTVFAILLILNVRRSKP
jgi:hypothetical protein